MNDPKEKTFFSTDKPLDVIMAEVSAIQTEEDLLSYFSTLRFDNPENHNIIPLLNKIIEEKKKSLQELNHLKQHLSAVKDSPFLPESINQLSFNGTINRKWVLSNEYGHRIDEKHGTAFIFKERAKEFAEIIGLDADSIRLALTEAIQNLFEHGHGDQAQVEIRIDNIDRDDAFLEMSFKHHIPENKFYSLKDANRNADEGIVDFENSRGRGEFMMRELMDERRFINGTELDIDGKRVHFFKRILRKYKNPGKRKSIPALLPEFKIFLERLEKYQITVFMNIDYTRDTRQLVVAANEKDSDRITSVFKENGYSYSGTDHVRNYKVNYWQMPENVTQNSINEMIAEIEGLSSRAKLVTL